MRIRTPFPFLACSTITILAFAAGCATVPPGAPPASPPPVVADAPSTQPVVGSVVNEASVEFGSNWSSFRFASQSNPVTVQLTAPAPPIAAPPPAEPIALPAPSGHSAAQATIGGATPQALRGGATADAVRGGSSANAVRGYATAANARGTVTADSERGNYTVQVVRGNVQTVAGRNENASAVVRPDLTVSLHADPPTAAPGETVVYTITIKNISTIAARDVTITDYLPQQLQALSAHGATVVTDPDDSSTHLTIPGTLAPSASTTIQLLARVKPSPGRP